MNEIELRLLCEHPYNWALCYNGRRSADNMIFKQPQLKNQTLAASHCRNVTDMSPEVIFFLCSEWVRAYLKYVSLHNLWN
jgi:hypothetical protein